MPISPNPQKIEKERILNQNPLLQRVVVKPFVNSEYTVEEISNFIEECWKDYYRDPIRIIYSPDFMKYIGMEEQKRNYSLLAEYDGRLVATVLAFVNFYQKNGQHYGACISTGLTSAAFMRGKRIAQLLNHSLYEAFIDDGYDFGMFWLDSRFKAAGSSYQIYRKENKRIHAVIEKKIFGKFINYRRAAELLSLNLRQKAILKAGSVFLPAKSIRKGNLEILKLDPSMLSEALYFLKENQMKNIIQRKFLKKEMKRKLFFESENCKSVTYVARRNYRIRGLIYGFTNRIKATHTYLQVEGLLFHPSLSYNDRRIFVSAYEYEARRSHNCFALIIPSTVANDHLQKYGYVSLTTQVLGAFFYNDRLGYDEAPLENLHTELR